MNMKSDASEGANAHDLALQRQVRYISLFGREASNVLHESEVDSPHIDVYCFPPIEKPHRVRRILAAVPDYYAYITGGMSDGSMKVNITTPPLPTRLELTTFAKGIVRNDAADCDMTAWWLYYLAKMPFKEEMYLSVGHSVFVGKPIMPGSDMTSFFFAVTPFMSRRRLCHAAVRAEATLHVVPISSGEREYAMAAGSEKLVEYFHTNGIQPIFDVYRKPVM